MLGRLSQWTPSKNLTNDYKIKGFKEGANGLRIRFFNINSLKPDITINFGNTLEYIIGKPEAQLKRSIELLGKYGAFYKDWNYFVVEDSSYLKKISINSMKVLNENINHFIIKTNKFIVDIISPPPRIRTKKL